MDELLPHEDQSNAFLSVRASNKWTQITIGSLAIHVGSGITPFGGSKVYKPEGVVFIRSQNVTFEGLRLDDVAYIDIQTHESMRRSEVFAHDVLLNITGASIGRCCPVPEGIGLANVNQHVCAIRLPNPSREDAVFLSAILASHIGQAQIDRLNAGGNREGLNYEQLRAFVVPWPEQDERARIAEILGSVNAAIQQIETLIAKLKQIKAGLLHDLLTHGLDEHGQLRDPIAHPEQFKDSPLGRIPRQWETCALATVADVDRGKFAHRPRNDPNFYGGPYPFIQTGEVAIAGGGKLTTFSQTLNERGAAVSRQFPKDTIAITIAANIADTAILGFPMFFPDSVVGAVVKSPNNVRYIELCIRRAKRNLDARAPQSAQKNINLEDLRPLLIAVPESEEQCRIAAVYDAHDARIRAEEAYRDKLKQLKKGLMDDLLTGRVQVRVDENVGRLSTIELNQQAS